MSENEKRLREVLGAIAATAGESTSHTRALAAEAVALVCALSLEHAKTVEANVGLSNALLEAQRQAEVARDAALEEAANQEDTHGMHSVARRIRALTSQPARRLIDAEAVKIALGRRIAYASSEGHGWVAKELGAVADELGLDIDTTPASDGQRWLGRWSNQQPQHVHLGDEDRRPDDSEESHESPASDVYDEAAHHAPPGTCPGCDMPADGSQGHRFSCLVHGKRQVTLPAEKKPNDDERELRALMYSIAADMKQRSRERKASKALSLIGALIATRPTCVAEVGACPYASRPANPPPPEETP